MNFEADNLDWKTWREAYCVRLGGCKKLVERHKRIKHNYHHPSKPPMTLAEVYVRQLASRKQIKSEMTHLFSRRLFNADSFVHVDLMNKDPEDMLPNLIPLTDAMTLKVALKDSLKGDAIDFDDFRDDKDLRALERSSGIEITPFDFADYQSTFLAELLEEWTPSLYKGLGPYSPSEKQCRRFVAFVLRARREAFKNTRFAYEEIFND